MFYKLNSYNKDYYKIYDKRKKVDWNTIPSFYWIRESLQVTANDSLLDAGCGDGSFLTFLCDRSGASFTGIDISETALSLARENAPAFDYYNGDITSLPFPDNHFSKVISFNVIEHISDQDKAMRELRRVLKPGGIIVFGTNIRDSISWWLYQRIIGEHTHIREFTVEEFIDFIKGYFLVKDWTKSSGVFRPLLPIRWIFHTFLKGDILVKAVCDK